MNCYKKWKYVIHVKEQYVVIVFILRRLVNNAYTPVWFKPNPKNAVNNVGMSSLKAPWHKGCTQK